MFRLETWLWYNYDFAAMKLSVAKIELFVWKIFQLDTASMICKPMYRVGDPVILAVLRTYRDSWVKSSWSLKQLTVLYILASQLSSKEVINEAMDGHRITTFHNFWVDGIVYWHKEQHLFANKFFLLSWWISFPFIFCTAFVLLLLLRTLEGYEIVVEGPIMPDWFTIGFR